MQETNLAVIVAYINRYLLAFVVSALGAFCNDTMSALRSKTKINPLKILVPSIFNAFLLCALNDYFIVSFQIYMFICFFLGMWSFYIMKAFTNLKFVSILLKNILKAMKDPVSKGFSDTINELEKEQSNNDKRSNEKEE